MEGERQCGQTCADTAKIACLLCRSRPKNGRHDFCGLTCRGLALVLAPLILEIPKGHVTYDMGMCSVLLGKALPMMFSLVERMFKTAWKAGSSPIPAIKRVYKVTENEEFHRPYDLYRFVFPFQVIMVNSRGYRERVGPEECYRYHGTTRQCGLGVSTKNLCTSSTCAVCNILKTSFKVDLAQASGA